MFGFAGVQAVGQRLLQHLEFDVPAVANDHVELVPNDSRQNAEARVCEEKSPAGLRV